MASNNIKKYRIGSIVIMILGIILMIYMIKVEDEPGLLPLVLIVVGIVGFIITQMKIKKAGNLNTL